MFVLKLIKSRFLKKKIVGSRSIFFIFELLGLGGGGGNVPEILDQ